MNFVFENISIPDSVDVIVQLVPELVELGISKEKAVKCQGNDDFADDFNAEPADG